MTGTGERGEQIETGEPIKRGSTYCTVEQLCGQGQLFVRFFHHPKKSDMNINMDTDRAAARQKEMTVNSILKEDSVHEVCADTQHYEDSFW